MADTQIIDADAHLVQLADDSDVRIHMEKPYNEVLHSIFPGTGWDPSNYDLSAPSKWDSESHVQAMDKERIDLSILSPTQGLLVSQIPKQGLPTGYRAQIRDRDLAAAYCRGYNDYVAGICRQSPRLKAVGLVPFQDVPAAVPEVKRAVTELALAGIVVSSLGLSEHLGSSTFWPIYEEIQQLNVPLLVHNLSYQVPTWYRYPDTLLFQDTVGGSMETLHAFTGLMYGGIPEKFPELRVAFLNIGVGWIPYMMERMDKDFEDGAALAPILTDQPSKYMKQGKWYYATSGNETTLPFVLDWIGQDTIVFGSSYPDTDSPFPNAVSSIQQRKDISDQAKRNILGENAKRLFGLSL